MTRRYATASGCDSAGMRIRPTIAVAKYRPIAAMTIEMPTKNTRLVPTTRLACSRLFEPML